jgi:hypothetical protein
MKSYGILFFLLLFCFPKSSLSAADSLLSPENIDSTFAFLSSNHVKAREARDALRHVTGEGREAMDARVKEMASVYAEGLPSKIDAITTMDSVILIGRVLSFYHTVDILSENEGEWDRSILRDTSTSQLCSTPMTGLYLMFGYGYRYVYHDVKGQYLYSFKVTADSCGYDS